jgi:hypothetical protein
MREVADADRIRRFMQELGRVADREGTCYLTGGATAVLLGWRQSTIDVDILLVPETEALLRGIQRLKDELQINVELAWPSQFIPVPAGWEGRSIPEGNEGRLRFLHFDPYSQALAKIERGHAQDADDVAAMIERELVDRATLLASFDEIEPELYRFPAVDAPGFRRQVEAATRG